MCAVVVGRAPTSSRHAQPRGMLERQIYLFTFKTNPFVTDVRESVRVLFRSNWFHKCPMFHVFPAIYHMLQAVVMCYDITNYDSFQNLDDWYRLVVQTFSKGAMPYVAMVGNKCEKCKEVRSRRLAPPKEDDAPRYTVSRSTLTTELPVTMTYASQQTTR